MFLGEEMSNFISSGNGFKIGRGNLSQVITKISSFFAIHEFLYFEKFNSFF